MLKNAARALRRDVPSREFLSMFVLLVLFAACSPAGVSAEVLRRGNRGYFPQNPVSSRNIPQPNRDDVAEELDRKSVKRDLQDSAGAGTDSSAQRPLDGTSGFGVSRSRDSQNERRADEVVGKENREETVGKVVERGNATRTSSEADGASSRASRRSPIVDLVPQESNKNYHYQYNDDDEDDDYEDEDDGFSLFHRPGSFRDLPTAYRGSYFPRGQYAKQDPSAHFPRGRFGESGDAGAFPPRARLGEVEPPPSNERKGSDFGKPDERSMFNGGFNLPQAGGGPGPLDRFPQADMGPFPGHDRALPPLGLPPLEATLNRDVPIIDEPFPPMQIDIDNPMMVFKEVSEIEVQKMEKKSADGSAAAEISATCGTLTWTQYLSARYGGFRMFLVMLTLIYTFGVCCFMHIQYIQANLNDAEQELL